MHDAPRWDLCYTTASRGAERRTFDDFCKSYFADASRRVLLIGGGGFDPRSLSVANRLSPLLTGRLDAIFLREHREDPLPELLSRAEENVGKLLALIPTAMVEFVQIFSTDGSPVAGRNALKTLDVVDFSSLTDVFVDFSALSIGVSFPIVKQIFELREHGGFEFQIHLVVVSNPQTDDGIRAIVSDQAPYIHGFQGAAGIQAENRAKLWLPQLKRAAENALDKLWRQIDPHDTCPILPFPALHPRRPDDLLYAFRNQLGDWRVDPRSVIYASETNPLDVYRTLVRLHDEREEVFAESGGSQMIVSPIGSKVVGIGTLIAALDRPIAIRYIEAERYTMDETLQAVVSDESIVHILLSDEPQWEI